MPRYVIFAGVNGAGKTTLYYSNPRLAKLPRVNVDEIVRSLGTWSDPADMIKAGRIAVSTIRDYLQRGVSFNQEPTLCGKSILGNIKLAKSRGYQIEIYYVGLSSAELAVERVKKRVSDGGHDIPEADIRRRYSESADGLRAALAYCDKVELYDNTEIFRRIAVYENGSWDIRTDDVPGWCVNIMQK